MSETFKLKRDKYRKARGGYSRFLNLYCSGCKSHLFLYQKDGPGPLKRAYLDRILAPEILSSYQHEKLITVPNLACLKCGVVVGSPYVYAKEKRPAFLLNPSAFLKKVGKGMYPPILKSFTK
jgi:ribosomal protein S27E